MALVSVTTANSILLRALFPSHAFSFSLHRQFQPLSFSSAVLRRLPPCRVASPRPPLPPSENDSRDLKEVGTSLSKIQDRIQIFLAVLFWMSLFFWACAWDGRNRPNKGSRFRR